MQSTGYSGLKTSLIFGRVWEDSTQPTEQSEESKQLKSKTHWSIAMPSMRNSVTSSTISEWESTENLRRHLTNKWRRKVVWMDSDDVEQEVNLAFVLAVQNFNGRMKFSTWAYKMTDWHFCKLIQDHAKVEEYEGVRDKDDQGSQVEWLDFILSLPEDEKLVYKLSLENDVNGMKELQKIAQQELGQKRSWKALRSLKRRLRCYQGKLFIRAGQPTARSVEENSSLRRWYLQEDTM